jgi:hypothetical protein
MPNDGLEILRMTYTVPDECGFQDFKPRSPVQVDDEDAVNENELTLVNGCGCCNCALYPASSDCIGCSGKLECCCCINECCCKHGAPCLACCVDFGLSDMCCHVGLFCFQTGFKYPTVCMKKQVGIKLQHISLKYYFFARVHSVTPLMLCLVFLPHSLIFLVLIFSCFLLLSALLLSLLSLLSLFLLSLLHFPVLYCPLMLFLTISRALVLLCSLALLLSCSCALVIFLLTLALLQCLLLFCVIG